MSEPSPDPADPIVRIHVVLTAVADPEAAATLARRLVERRLAACVNILPGVRSLYFWQGRLQDEPEALLLIKTAADPEIVFAAIRELHPYELPELVAFPAGPVEGRFARWVAEGSAAV